MIKVFLGTDFKKRKEAIREFLFKESVQSEVKIDGESLSREVIEEILSSTSLFGEKKSLLIFNPSVSAESWKLFVALLKEMQESEVLVVIEEETLSAPRLKEISKYGEVLTFDLKTPKAKVSPIAFKLTDAFLKKDKKEMWTKYIEALRSGEEPEALHGALFWQVKGIGLAHETNSAQEAGLAPFVYTKAKQGTRVYSKEAVSKISNELVSLYHNSRESGEDLGENLERWILGIK